MSWIEEASSFRHLLAKNSTKLRRITVSKFKKYVINLNQFCKMNSYELDVSSIIDLDNLSRNLPDIKSIMIPENLFKFRHLSS